MDRSRPGNPNPTDASAILFLSLKHVFQRMAYWIPPNFWSIMLSLGVITWPAAKAALYQAVREGLLDPAEIRTNPRLIVRQAFFEQFGRSFVLVFVNLVILVFSFVSLVFWLTRDEFLLNMLSMLPLFCLAVWWLGQPYLFPIMVEYPKLPIFHVMKMTVRLVLSQPLYALVITSINTMLTLVGIIFFGPVLLIVPALVGVISFHAYWDMTGREIPALIDPEEYANRYDISHRK
jgi:uncharacterized membrane protein YesL